MNESKLNKITYTEKGWKKKEYETRDRNKKKEKKLQYNKINTDKCKNK